MGKGRVNMKKKAVIFDLDGTLVDTLDSIEISVNRTMDRLGYEHITRKQCREFVGNGARVLIEKSLKSITNDVNDDKLDEAMKIYQEEFSTYCTYNVNPYNGVVDMLQQLKIMDYRLAVLTNKPHAQAIIAVKELFGDEIFDLIQGQIDGFPRKPEPESLWAVIKELGLENDECVFVGDSEVDIQTGKRADIYTIGVAWGFRDEDVLQREKADVVVHTAIEIVNVVE